MVELSQQKKKSLGQSDFKQIFSTKQSRFITKLNLRYFKQTYFAIWHNQSYNHVGFLKNRKGERYNLIIFINLIYKTRKDDGHKKEGRKCDGLVTFFTSCCCMSIPFCYNEHLASKKCMTA